MNRAESKFRIVDYYIYNEVGVLGFLLNNIDDLIYTIRKSKNVLVKKDLKIRLPGSSSSS